MKIEVLKDVSYYLGLPYTVTIRRDDEGDFVARISELAGCIAHGENEATSIENLHAVQRLWIEEALDAGNPIPEPEAESEMPSGKWVQRVPRRLHRDLVSAARRDNVSLNQLVTSMLSEALAVSNCTHAFQVFLARETQPVPLSRDIFDLAWPVESASEIVHWSSSPHMQVGDIIQSLKRIKNLTPSTFSDEPYADEHRETHKRFARR